MTTLSHSRWKIERDLKTDTYSLTHPSYSPVPLIPNFDEAHELLKAVENGTFIEFVTKRENFYEALHKRIRGL